MKIKFLGTGAADWPLERPEWAVEFRRMSSAVVDSTLLIDPGPQVIDALREYGNGISAIKYIINTHRHSDHYDENTVNVLTAAGAEFVDFKEGDCKTLGKYTVTAYHGNHDTCAGTVHFMISDGEKTLFYGLDGAWLGLGEFDAIRKYKPSLTVIDATVGFIDGDYRIFEHNNLNMVLEMQKTLKPYVGKICISHMAKTLHTDHKTLSDEMQKYGITAAYDGLELEI